MKRYSFLENIIFDFAIGVAVLVGASPLVAQRTAGQDGIPVHMVVTAEPHHGQVPVINKEDVMVFQQKDRDTVTEWVPAQGDRAALELFILLDDASNDEIANQFDDIRKFINGQPSTTKIGVAYMQNGIAKIAQDLTSDHEQAGKALRLPMGIRGANGSPYFSLADLVKRWPATSARREVLMATDGVDLYYGTGDLQDPYVQEAIDGAQRAGILVSAIYTPGSGHTGHNYWQNYWGQLYVAELADKTGGEAYDIGFTGPAVSFAPFLEAEAKRLSHQYLLTFLAKPPKKAGFEDVKVKTEVPNVDLVSANRVWVSPEGK